MKQIEKSINIAANVSTVWRHILDQKKFSVWSNIRLDTPFMVRRPTTGSVISDIGEKIQIEFFVKDIQ